MPLITSDCKPAPVLLQEDPCTASPGAFAAYSTAFVFKERPGSWSSAAVPAKDITAISLHFQCPGFYLRRVQEQASSCPLPAGEPTASISGTKRASLCSDVEYPACEDVRTTNPSSRLQSGQATAVQNSHIAHCGYY